MKIGKIIFSALTALLAAGFISCSDMLKVDSKVVVYEENHKLNQATDTVYSVMGIIRVCENCRPRCYSQRGSR